MTRINPCRVAETARASAVLCIDVYLELNGANIVYVRFVEPIDAGTGRESGQVVNCHLSKGPTRAEQNSRRNKRYGNKNIFHFRKTL
ncbi:hypothetical protein [Pedobacter sp. V48]|uniref:hypothetical protein n=1 Tax=Pedobacter sp. V48 TaxID=509635 RepID=UPI0004B9E062|nr:hypothetical protein [Pedobacter sp. V48]